MSATNLDGIYRYLNRIGYENRIDLTDVWNRYLYPYLIVDCMNIDYCGYRGLEQNMIQGWDYGESSNQEIARRDWICRDCCRFCADCQTYTIASYSISIWLDLEISYEICIRCFSGHYHSSIDNVIQCSSEDCSNWYRTGYISPRYSQGRELGFPVQTFKFGRLGICAQCLWNVS